MGIQFHESVYGQRFFDMQLPKLIKAIERLAEATEQHNRLMSENKTPDCQPAVEKMLLCRKQMRDGDGAFMYIGNMTRCTSPKKALEWADQVLEKYKKKGFWPVPEAEAQFLEDVYRNLPCCLVLYPQGDITQYDVIRLTVKAI